MTDIKLSPSSAHRWTKCPGSARLEAQYPRSERNEAAIDGTHTHKLLEICLNEKQDAEYYVGKTLVSSDGEFVVDHDRARRVQFALDYINRINATYLFTESKVPPWLPELSNGYIDILIDGEDCVELIDFKDGRNKVDVNYSEQMELYAIYICNNLKGIEKIKLTIIQPRLDSIESRMLDAAEVFNLRLKYELAVQQATAPTAPLKAGKHCKYCKHAGNCKILATNTIDVLNISEIEDVAHKAASKRVTDLTDHEIREFIEAKPVISDFLKAVEGEALKRLKSGHVEGLSLTRTRGNRKWIGTEEEVIKNLRKLKIEKDDAYIKKLISPNQAEKFLTKKQIDKMNSEFCTKNEGGLKVSLATEVPEVDVSEFFTKVN